VSIPRDPTTELLVAFARMEGKVDVIAGNVQTSARVQDDHEVRLRRLEGSRWPLRSIAALSGLAAASAAVIALWR
jgi:hypothetical protein